jgi:hypothetical protein
VSSPNKSDRVKHSPGGIFKSLKHASTNLKAGFFGFFAAMALSICNGSAGCRELYMVMRGVPFLRHLHSEDTGSMSSPSSSLSVSFKWEANPGTCDNLCFRFTQIWYSDREASARWLMILFVATTAPPFAGATRVAELVMEDNDVVDEDAYAVEPDIWEDRDAWLMVWLRPGRPEFALRVGNTGAVFVLVSGP